jgi:hypothetical protein
MRRRGKEPKDYAKANARAIKDLENRMRAHSTLSGCDGDSVATGAHSTGSPALKLTKSSLYKNVKARVAQPPKRASGTIQDNQV